MQVHMGALTMMGVLTTSLMILGSLAYTGITIVQARPFGDDDIEAHLNHLNKPAIKSIMLKDGDVGDCVDIYKQPAFDHPLLKKHKIETMLSFIVERKKSNEPHMQPLWQESEGCPDGTIPIRRVQKNDIIRTSSTDGSGNRDLNGGKIEGAGIYLEGDVSYYGAQAAINLWSPLVEENEWSRATIAISGNNVTNGNFLEVGWVVNPQLFGDGKARFYVYWTADAYRNTGCYNLFCPGFVQVSKKYVLGSQIGPLSEKGGTQYSIPMSIYKNNEDQRWWLHVFDDEPVGYWPPELFNNSFPDTSTIIWAGGIFNTKNGGNTTTQMGSGERINGGWGHTAFFQNVRVKTTADGNFVMPIGLTHVFTTQPACYDAFPDQSGKDLTAFYGGTC